LVRQPGDIGRRQGAHEVERLQIVADIDRLASDAPVAVPAFDPPSPDSAD